MTPLTGRGLVSGTAGSVTVTPGDRIVVGTTGAALEAAELDAIVDADGLEAALRSAVGSEGDAAILAARGDVVIVGLLGDVAADIRRPETEWFVRPRAGSFALVELPSDTESVTVGVGARTPDDLSLDGATSRRAGSGPGDRVLLDLATPEVGSTPPDGVDLVDLTVEPDVLPAPLAVATLPPPQPDAAEVLGVRCPVGHHNHPDAEYCSTCGRKMGVNATLKLVLGPRPPVGLFLADDGAAIPIASDMLIGREPLTHPDVEAGRRQPVFMADESNTVSRHHVAVTLNGWDVEVTDLGSANGASIVRAATGSGARLISGQPTPMGAGDELHIGPRRLRLSLHHVAS